MTGRRVALASFLALLGLGSFRGSAVAPEGEKTGPIVRDYGPVFDVPDPDFPTPRDRDDRVVFDVSSAPAETDALAPSIVTVARFLNMHARTGVPAERLQPALVLHGNAGKYALANEAYRKRFGTDNPNLDLLGRLKEAGTRVILCGQTAASRGFEKGELAPSVELALSAMTALVTLQQDGYALIAF